MIFCKTVPTMLCFGYLEVAMIVATLANSRLVQVTKAMIAGVADNWADAAAVIIQHDQQPMMQCINVNSKPKLGKDLTPAVDACEAAWSTAILQVQPCIIQTRPISTLS